MYIGSRSSENSILGRRLQVIIILISEAASPVDSRVGCSHSKHGHNFNRSQERLEKSEQLFSEHLFPSNMTK
jgi:hypothetical protein